jgi:hypothetical protein
MHKRMMTIYLLLNDELVKYRGDSSRMAQDRAARGCTNNLR